MKTLLNLRKSMPEPKFKNANYYTFGKDVLIIERGDSLFAAANFGPETQTVGFRKSFKENIFIVYFSSSGHHVEGGEYLFSDFELGPYEGIVAYDLNVL